MLHRRRAASLGAAMRPVAFAFALCAVGAPDGALAQQSDGTGGGIDAGPLEGFVFETDPTAPADGDVPSLSTDDALAPVGPEVRLQITQGQSGVALQTFPGTGAPVTSVIRPATSQAPRMVLRALDKMLGRPTDIDLALGETVVFGRLSIRAVECRYPTEDPTSDAFAHVEILDAAGAALFNGWMIASSPALSALEHPRYDFWVLRCETP